MIDKVYRYMKSCHMIPPGRRILVAVSGGADSMCLLEVLRVLQERAELKIRVLHVHHGLRESAEDDLQYVAKYCKEAGIPFQAVRVDAAGYAAANGLSVEEAARHLRYEALEKAAKEWDQQSALEKAVKEWDQQPAPEKSSNKKDQQPDQSDCRIAVAHHIEDQSETVLFNLVRGSRLTGLRGMLPVNGRIIRPLLCCSREEIESCLVEHGITWREDETNEDVRYARNLLRREVMPLLEKINAGAVQHIAKAAEEAAETEEFLRAETEKAMKKCRETRKDNDSRAEHDGRAEHDSPNSENQHPPIILSIPILLEEPPLIRRRVVYEVIAETAGRKKDLRDVHVQDVLKMAQKNGNGRLDVFAGVLVEKVYDKLIFLGDVKSARKKDLSKAESPTFLAERRWPMEASEYSCRVFDFDGNLAAVSRKQYTKWFDYDKIGTFPSFRTRREGDRIALDESGRSKSIARYMIDAKIPAELRAGIVLPAAGKEILWVPAGLNGGAETIRSSDSGRINASYMVSGSTRRILEIRWEPETGQSRRELPEYG